MNFHKDILFRYLSLFRRELLIKVPNDYFVMNQKSHLRKMFIVSKERLLRLEEAIQIIRKLWTEDPSLHLMASIFQIKNAFCNPKPIQKPSPPIMVGGNGERLSPRIVAKYADACNLFGSPKP